MNFIINALRKLIVISLLIQLLIIAPVKVFAESQEAIFAGGCFWCLEHDLEKLNGVISAESGYSGGDLMNPSYEKHAGHQEVVKVIFDSKLITYEELLQKYWINIDPFDKEGQFCDRGNSYIPVIFTSGLDQELKAKESKEWASSILKTSKNQLNVNIKNAKTFWIAESYHQDFAERNSIKYNIYRLSCGRDKRLRGIWGEKS